jgi:hypothetical protein
MTTGTIENEKGRIRKKKTEMRKKELCVLLRSLGEPVKRVRGQSLTAGDSRRGGTNQVSVTSMLWLDLAVSMRKKTVNPALTRQGERKRT